MYAPPSLRVVALAAGVLSLAGCSGPAHISGSRVVIPTSVGEGHNDEKKPRPKPAPGTGAAESGAPSSAGTAGASATEPAPQPDEHGTKPDPSPLSTAHQFDLTVRYSKGTMSFVAARAVELPRPVLTPRRMGRFAVELWIGSELVDRVRFDFPLLGADLPEKPGPKPIRGGPARFAPGADTSCHVQVPASDRATSARLVDRLSGESVNIPWPPLALAPAPAAPPKP
jgi:hypothetical protein